MLWERRRGDVDFGVARIGLGAQTLATELIAPDTKPMEQLEPLSALALRRFITTYSSVSDLPLAMAVSEIERCSGHQFDPECAEALGSVFIHAVEEQRTA